MRALVEKTGVLLVLGVKLRAGFLVFTNTAIARNFVPSDD